MPAGQWTVVSSLTPGFGTLSGTAGALTTLLDQLLVNGNTAQSVTSITRSGTTATSTTSATHGFWDSTNGTGQYFYVTIAGAAQSDYNGTFLALATGTTTFTYTVANSPTTPATGTITWQIPGFGWSTAFTGTNKRMYLNGAGAVSRRYFKVRDDAGGTGGAKEALIRGFVTVGDVDGTVNTLPFPTNAQSALTANCLVLRKSTTADATARSWVACGDDRTLHLFILTGDVASSYFCYHFGEYTSYIASDPTGSLISGGIAENSGTAANASGAALRLLVAGGVEVGTANTGCYTCGDNAGFNNSTAFGAAAHMATSTTQLGGNISYPNLGDGGLYLAEIPIYRNNASSPAFVGKLRGLRCPMHPTASFTDRQIFNGSGELAGRQFLMLKTANPQSCLGTLAIETTLPDYSV